MKLERFDAAADSESVRACHDIFLAGAPADDPDGPPMLSRRFAAWLKLGWTEDPQECWLARGDSGEPCGWYLLALPQRENRHLAELTLVVHPARRRAGLGTALLAHAGARAGELGRTVLQSGARAGSPGSAFARARGARQGFTDVRRVLDLRVVTGPRLAALRKEAESSAGGYSLLSWGGPIPEEQLAGVVAVTAAIADIPREAGHDPQHWDAERVRLGDARVAAQGVRQHTVAARSLATGELAGLTQLSVDPADPGWGHQDLTAVTRPHRGHRIGLLVKVAMLQLLAEQEPQVTKVVTVNAEQNQHMIAINAELGFGVLDQWLAWEVAADRRS
jgi:GNAT superfamily N-acetyltransferase